MLTNPTRRPLADELHRQGFKRDRTGRDPLIYTKRLADRILTVQLWRIGQHRVSRALITEHGSHEFTLPTDFYDKASMKAAIITETETPFPPRPDHAAIS